MKITETNHLTINRPIKVIQFGKGNFLRGYMDWMIDILNEKTKFKGNIQIIESRDNGLAKLLNEQNGLYHVVLEGLENGKKIQDVRLITSVTNVLNPSDDYKAFLKLGKNPKLEFIISNTTEAGIEFDPDDKDFNTLPKSFPARLTALLYYRFLHFKNFGDKNLAIIPCELIEQNGNALKNIIIKYIDYWALPDGFKNWIENKVTFCNTLVDRIVPGFPKDTITAITPHLKFEDTMVVKAEPYHLLIIEAPDYLQNSFPAPSAGLNVKFVKDLTPYRERKVRILNGIHTAMVPVGYLKGMRTVREMMEDNNTTSFIKQIIFDEIIPTLYLPHKELIPFANSVLERFKNPFIEHHLESIALNSISKFKVRVLPSLLSYVEKEQRLPEGLTISLAYLIVFYRGHFNDQPIPLKDDQVIIDFFKNTWKTDDPEFVSKAVLSNTNLWDTDLTLISGLSDKITLEIQKIITY